MKKIINWFKDLIYNSTDYAIILVVVVVVATILFWRFDILFSLKIEKDPLTENPITISNNSGTDNNPNSPKDGDKNPNDDDPNDENSPNSPEEGDSDGDNSPNQGGNTNAEGDEVTFNIPPGTFPGKIADILISNSLIEDKQTFITRCVELKLDTKLKSGEFIIKRGTALDDVIKILAKQN